MTFLNIIFPVALHHKSCALPLIFLHIFSAFHSEPLVHTACPDGIYSPLCSFTRSVTKAQLKGPWGEGSWAQTQTRAHTIPPGSCRTQSHRLCSWRWWGNLTLANVAHLHSRYPIRLWRLQYGACASLRRLLWVLSSCFVCLLLHFFYLYIYFGGYFLQITVRRVGGDAKINIKKAKIITKIDTTGRVNTEGA